MRSFSFAVVAPVLLGALVSLGGCPAPDVVTAEDGAAHLGLQSGKTLSYAVSEGLTETHSLQDSGVLFDGVKVDVVARQNGFANDERSLTLGVDVEQVSILRFQDCIARCGALDRPIAFLQWPLSDGQTTSGEAVVTRTGFDDDDVRTERHATAVSGPVSVTVPAGTFDDAFLIAWTRTLVDAAGAESTGIAQLHWVPEIGVVKHDAFDDTRLELNVTP